MTSKPSPFAANLRAALGAAGMTQEQLARRLDVSNRTVAGWCLGETQPRWNTLTSVAEELHRSPSWFYTDGEDEEAA